MAKVFALLLRGAACLTLMSTLTASHAFGQDLSEFEVDPVDATVFDPTGATGVDQDGATVIDQDDPDPAFGGAKTAPLIQPRGGTFRSESLKGEFVAEWMRITIGGQNGNSFLFWGARAISLDKDSPLRDLKVSMNRGVVERFQVGDVITRIDDVKIDDGMFRKGNGPWQIPELDEHFGPSTFRWIKTGHSHVNVSSVVLDNNARRGPSGGGLPPVTP